MTTYVAGPRPLGLGKVKSGALVVDTGDTPAHPDVVGSYVYAVEPPCPAPSPDRSAGW